MLVQGRGLGRMRVANWCAPICRVPTGQGVLEIACETLALRSGALDAGTNEAGKNSHFAAWTMITAR